MALPRRVSGKWLVVDVAGKQKWVTPILHIERPDGRVWEGYAQVIAVKDGPQFNLKAQIPQLLGQPHLGTTWGGKVATQIASEPDDVLASREGAGWLIGCAQVIDEHIEGWRRKGKLLFKGGHHWLLNEQLPEGSVGVRSMGAFTDADHIP